MGTEGNALHSSQPSDFGVLEQCLGFRIGDATNIGRSPAFNPTIPSQVVGSNLAFNKSLASTNTSLSPALLGSQIVLLQKGPQSNPVSVSGAQHENWGESNMVESSSRTNTSTDADDKNQPFEKLQDFLDSKIDISMLGVAIDMKPRRYIQTQIESFWVQDVILIDEKLSDSKQYFLTMWDTFVSKECTLISGILLKKPVILAKHLNVTSFDSKNEFIHWIFSTINALALNHLVVSTGTFGLTDRQGYI